jgi:LysM repeat protein
MDTHDDRTDFFPRRSQMSTFAINPGFTREQTRRRTRPARSTAPAVRLTRRGQIVAVLLFLGLVLAVLTVYGSHSAATGEAGAPVPTRTVEVGGGDTLWGIASEVAKPGQVRDMVQRIQELNALSGSSVSVGQEIAVPVD